MSNDFLDKVVVDAALGDLTEAYRLVSEIAKTSRGNSKNKKDAIIALTLMENGFTALSHYGSPGISATLKTKIEKARIIPMISV